MKVGYSQWRKLDNAALAFPAVTDKNDTRVFRFYCQLREDVDGEILQRALDLTMEKYPLFRAVLRKGLFWFYLEQRDLHPEVKKESRPPCSRLYIPDKKSLLFEVTYYEKRINFEVFHALTDGTGAMNFLEELVRNYLKLAHPEVEFPEKEEETVTGRDLEEDSFSQYYSSDVPKSKEKSQKAVKLGGEKLAPGDMHITEVVLSVKETLAKAREYKVSITVLLTAVLLCAIHEEVPKNQSKNPIGLMIPVNLRNYFPSKSMANFFGWIEVGYAFGQESTFTDVLESVKEQFTKELSKERIAMRMNDLVRLEKHPALRIVPLELKTLVLQAGTTFGGKGITAVYSNVGVIRLPEIYNDYIHQFGIFASTNSLQLCSCSFGDELVVGITSKYVSNSVERNYVENVKKENLACKEEVNKFPGLENRTEQKDGKKFFESFTFLCIAIAVICSMVDFIMDKSIGWAWFVTAGCFCTWVLVSVAYTKRRNLLKNATWQLLLVTIIGILWDVFTGWIGWSVDYLFPLACLAVICSIPVIAWVQHLEIAEYLFYLMQASAIGWIPFILVLTKTVTVTYPSIICTGTSFLFIVWLVLFKRKDVQKELHKKLRL